MEIKDLLLKKNYSNPTFSYVEGNSQDVILASDNLVDENTIWDVTGGGQ